MLRELLDQENTTKRERLLAHACEVLLGDLMKLCSQGWNGSSHIQEIWLEHLDAEIKDMMEDG